METKVKEVVITKIFKNYESREGKKYKNPLVAICFNGDDGVEYKASAFVEDPESVALGWEKGDTVTLKLYKNGEYVNFLPPTKIDELIKRVEALEAKVFGGSSAKVAPKNNPNATVEEIEEAVKSDELPW